MLSAPDWTSAQTCDRDAPATYTAAVVEYSPALGVTEENVAQRFQDNIRTYKDYITIAKKERADIVVFPECGLATLELPRLTDGSPAVSVDISNIGSNPCIEKDMFHDQEMRDLSCAARDSGVYVVVNLPEREHCSPALSFCPECPGFDARSVPSGVVACGVNGFRFFNTDVAFDRKGTVVARYRKYNLFGEPGFVAPANPELVTFDTDFGVRFGMFTCFDLMFDRPAVELVAEAGVTDIIFPTAWFSELPFLTAVQAQASWAWAMDVNLLASGYNLPMVGSTGSGLYAGRRGVVAATMERSRTSKMLVGKLPNTRSCEKDHTGMLTGIEVKLQGPQQEGEASPFASDLPPPQTTIECIKALPEKKVTIPSLYKCHLKSMLQLKEGRHIVHSDTGEAAEEDDTLIRKKKFPTTNVGVSEDDGNEEERLRDQAEIREALAPRPDGDAKLIYGKRYRQFVQDTMIQGMRQLQKKSTRRNENENDDEYVERERSPVKKSLKSNINWDKNEDEYHEPMLKRRLQQKSERQKEEEEAANETPSIDEIAETMMSGMKEPGVTVDKLHDIVESHKEEEEKAKYVAKPQPSVDEMERVLLGKLQEVSGNMTAEGAILDDVMMDLEESDQRETMERKLILERCQQILADIKDDRGEERRPEGSGEEEEEVSLPIIEDTETDEFGDSKKQIPESIDGQPEEENLEISEQEPEEPSEDDKGRKADAEGDNIEGGNEFDLFRGDQVGDEGDGQEVNEMPPPEDQTGETQEQTSIHKNLEPHEPIDEAISGADDSTPETSDESSSLVEQPSFEEFEQTPETSSETAESTEDTYQPAHQEKKLKPKSKSKSSRKKKDPTDETAEETSSVTSKEEYLYLKTEDLSKYSTLLLTAETVENSTVIVCHGIFCCQFTVALNVADLPSAKTGYIDHGLSFAKGYKRHDIYNLDGYINERDHDEFQGYAKLYNGRRSYARRYLVKNDDDDASADGEDDKVDNDDNVEMSEMEPDEDLDDEDDVDLPVDIDEGPVFLQSTVLKQLQVGDSHPGQEPLTMEDMEPSEKIIQEEKKVKDRIEKAMADGMVEPTPPPTIPSTPGHKPGEEKLTPEGKKERSKTGKVKPEQHPSIEEPEESDIKGEGAHEIVSEEQEDSDITVEDTHEILSEEPEGSDTTVEDTHEIESEEPEESDIAGEESQEIGSEEQEEAIEEAIDEPKETEKPRRKAPKGPCKCEGCEGALEAGDYEYGDEEHGEEERGDDDDDESRDENVGGEGRRVRTPKSSGKKKIKAPKRYYYRLAVYNGIRSFDGVADGALQVCAVIACTDMSSVDSCGKLHDDQAVLLPTTFKEVKISGRFQKKNALTLPSTLGRNMLPLPANAFTLRVTPQKGDEAEVVLMTNDETSFVTFGIYSRNFENDPERSINVG